jgi:hypothetical protein
MEAFYRFVRRLVYGFGGAGLDYAFTGALAESFYGAPRTTTNVDVVVAVSGLDVKAILQFTIVDLEAVKKQAKKDKTLEVLEGLIE